MSYKKGGGSLNAFSLISKKQFLLYCMSIKKILGKSIKVKNNNYLRKKLDS